MIISTLSNGFLVTRIAKLKLYVIAGAIDINEVENTSNVTYVVRIKYC